MEGARSIEHLLELRLAVGYICIYGAWFLKIWNCDSKLAMQFFTPIVYKKIDDVFHEEYKAESSAKKKEAKEERRKKV